CLSGSYHLREQLRQVNGDKKAYDLEIRPRPMVHAIEQLRNPHVQPVLRKIEGLDRREDCESAGGGRDSFGCIILGRREDDKRCTNGWRMRLAFPVSLASLWAAQISAN